MEKINGRYAHESVLYEQARAKMDAECASATDDCRTALEDVADIVGERIKIDTEACRSLLEGDKTLKGAYDAMRGVVAKRVKPERGKVVCGSMGPSEARRVILDYFGIDDRASEERPAQNRGIKSVYDFI